jgi:hypothetical protein
MRLTKCIFTKLTSFLSSKISDFVLKYDWDEEPDYAGKSHKTLKTPLKATNLIFSSEFTIYYCYYSRSTCQGSCWSGSFLS